MKQITIKNPQIRPQLINYLNRAGRSIHLAIGWIDDVGLMSLFQKKVIKGLDVTLVLIQEKHRPANHKVLEQFIKQGGKVVWLGEEFREQLIDHKFGVVDKKVVFSGTYAWGHTKSPKEPFLNIAEQLPTLADGFEKEFDYLTSVNQSSKKNSKPANDITPLLKKLEILKALIAIGDTKYILMRLKGLKNFKEDENVALIMKTLRARSFDDAHVLLEKFTQYHQPLLECINPPFDNLRREIEILEEEIAAVSNEYNELQKTLHDFSQMHSANLGDLLEKILYQSKIKAAFEALEDDEKQAAFEEATKDHEEFSKSNELAQQQTRRVLTPKERKELKQIYRQTSLKCHPDRVVDELHEQAEELFVELNKAYKDNNLERLKEISEQLKSGVMLSKSEGITELKKLDSTVKNLTQKLNDWLSKLDELKQLPTYQTISRIEDWEVYFEETRAILENQLARITEFNESKKTVSTTVLPLEDLS